MKWHGIREGAPREGFGSHLLTHSADQIWCSWQEFDTNQNGVLDREEFAAFLERFTKNVSSGVTKSLLIYAAAPLLAMLAKRATEQLPRVGPVVRQIPNFFYATVVTTAVAILGQQKTVEDWSSRAGRWVSALGMKWIPDYQFDVGDTVSLNSIESQGRWVWPVMSKGPRNRSAHLGSPDWKVRRHVCTEQDLHCLALMDHVALGPFGWRTWAFFTVLKSLTFFGVSADATHGVDQISTKMCRAWEFASAGFFCQSFMHDLCQIFHAWFISIFTRMVWFFWNSTGIEVQGH